MDNSVESLKFYYRNYKGEYAYRTVQNPLFWFGNTEFHREPQWLIKAYDVEKQDFRDFAVKDIIEFL